MKNILFLLLFVGSICKAQLSAGMGWNTVGLNLNIASYTKDIKVTGGISVPFASATMPQIISLSIGKIWSMKYVDLIPSIGLANYRKDDVRNYELIRNPTTVHLIGSMEVSKNVAFGKINLNLNYCNGFYAGAGINAFFSETSEGPLWWKPNKKEWISYAFYSGSGIAKGYHDAVVYHHYGRGNYFWDIDRSWKRKYKNYDAGDRSEAFPLSTSALVVFTDANHSLNALDVTAFASGTAINFSNIRNELKIYPKGQRIPAFILKKILYPIAIRSIAFESVFKVLKIKK